MGFVWKIDAVKFLGRAVLKSLVVLENNSVKLSDFELVSLCSYY